MEAIHKAQLALGKYGLGHKKAVPTFSEFAPQYLEYSKAHKQAYSVERYYIPKILKPFFGRYRLHEITPLLVEKYKRERLGKGLKKSSVNRELGLLKSMLNTAVKWQLLDRNNARDGKFYKLDEPLSDRTLSYEEEAKVLAACDHPELKLRAPHLKSIIVVATNTGLRRSEIFRLRWEDIDFENSVLTVRKSKTRAGQGRQVSLNTALAEMLLLLKQDAEGEWVFPSPKDSRKPIGDVKHSFARAVEDGGIPKITFHQLRHTFCTRLEEAGVPLSVIQELAGHASITMTRRYTHPSNALKQKAVELLLEGRKEPVPATKSATLEVDLEEERAEEVRQPLVFPEVVRK
jgi:integrase